MYRFPLFETIAVIDGRVQNLAYHQARLDYAMRAFFHSGKRHCLNDIIRVPREFRQGLVRLRADYNEAMVRLRFFAYKKPEIMRFQCVYTENLEYRFKYTDRKRLDLLKNLQSDEVVIVNNGKVSDCTIGNLLFLKENQWYSPQDYLLKGTQLSCLLEANQVVLTEILPQDLAQYERIMLINALNPFDMQRSLPISAVRF